MTPSQQHPAPPLPHHLILENRNQLSLSGVLEVKQFEQEVAVIITSMGLLTLMGSDFHLLKSDTDTGELLMQGQLTEFYYTDQSDPASRKKKFGFFRSQE